MDQMRLERKGLSVDLIFARGMKMKLLQFENLAVNSHSTPGSVVDLDGVPIVDDFIAPGFIIEFERIELRINKVCQIDGRLVFPRAI